MTINGSGSSEGPTISYEWTPLAGIISGETTLFPEVATSGTYTLTVTNSISGCTATAEATVLEDTTLPMAVASSPGNLACQTNTLTLSGLGSSTGAGFSVMDHQRQRAVFRRNNFEQLRRGSRRHLPIGGDQPD
ncbi:MAG: hypothetical protein R2788_19470 [Saprospiraceae bacterium]